ncbi:hypothetical protein NDU88_000431 [Pleurodeles waltl]|uniref:Uncharacterized protein n=1 Tax=Pleurodeles waltl TaxID=8319 RepID=A0AAV7P5P0_PLEWA|nr:hypothetical protein NDU88_000431 [Pleurodeles waltl]
MTLFPVNSSGDEKGEKSDRGRSTPKSRRCARELPGVLCSCLVAVVGDADILRVMRGEGLKADSWSTSREEN